MSQQQQKLHISMKNIPMPSDKVFVKYLQQKAESFIKRIREKVYFFEKILHEDETKNKFGSKLSNIYLQTSSYNRLKTTNSF